MESVPSAFIVVFIIVFAALTLTGGLLGSQESMLSTLDKVEVRLQALIDTRLTPVSVPTTRQILNSGTQVQITLRNTGSRKLADYAQWNLIAECYDVSNHYQVQALRFVKGTPQSAEWGVEKIYLDSQQKIAEQIEPNVLNPGEEIVLAARLPNSVGIGKPCLLVVATGNGQRASVTYVRNIPPQLGTNVKLRVAIAQRKVIGKANLLATDPDNEPADLKYTVVTAPTQGVLNLPERFTQADLDAGKLTYTYTGSGPDSFKFTIEDGIDTSEIYTLNIVPNARPVLATNTGLTLPFNTTATITTAMLQTTDDDDLPSALTYTVTAAPSDGQLGLGTTFTQADIDKGYLKYTHNGPAAGTDTFQFQVSDGDNLIGTFTFNIQAN